jgi:hypothetical protein
MPTVAMNDVPEEPRLRLQSIVGHSPDYIHVDHHQKPPMGGQAWMAYAIKGDRFTRASVVQDEAGVFSEQGQSWPLSALIHVELNRGEGQVHWTGPSDIGSSVGVPSEVAKALMRNEV